MSRVVQLIKRHRPEPPIRRHIILHTSAYTLKIGKNQGFRGPQKRLMKILAGETVPVVRKDPGGQENLWRQALGDPSDIAQ